MEIIDSQPTSDQYTNATTIDNVYRSPGGYFTIDGADVFMQLQYGRQGMEYWTDEIHVPPNNGSLFAGTIGVRFRSYLSGTPATISAALSEPPEPVFALNAGGQGNGVGVSALPVFNVQAAPYKAKGDGVTDDTKAIQNAISDACSAGGGIVWFPHGTYLCLFTGAAEFKFVPCSNVCLWGAGQESVVLKASGSVTGTNNALILVQSVSNVTIRDMTLNLNNVTGVGGVRGDSSNRIRLTNVTINNEGTTGATSEYLFSNSQDLEVEGCRFLNIFQAVVFAGCTRSRFINNYVQAGAAFTGQLFLSGSSTDLVCMGNFLDGSSIDSAQGISADGQGSIVGNVCIGVDMGIHLEDPEVGFTVSGNYLVAKASATHHGILLLGNVGTVNGVSITGNTIQNFVNGIQLAGAGNNVVSGNTISGSANEAILLLDDATPHHSNGNLISGNVISGCSTSASGTFPAISIQKGQVNQVVGNSIRTAAGAQPKYGVQDDASSVENQFFGNQIQGMATAHYNVQGLISTATETDTENTQGFLHTRQIYGGSGNTAGAFQTAAGLLGGTGAPNNAVGNNGDFFLRSDGGAGTHIYFKSGGAWAGIV